MNFKYKCPDLHVSVPFTGVGRDVATDDPHVQTVRLFRNQQEVAVGYIPKKDSPHQIKEVRNGEACVVITSSDVIDLAPGDSVAWNEK